MVKLDTTCSLKHAMTELIAAFTVGEMQVNTSFAGKKKGKEVYI